MPLSGVDSPQSSPTTWRLRRIGRFASGRWRRSRCRSGWVCSSRRRQGRWSWNLWGFNVRNDRATRGDGNVPSGRRSYVLACSKVCDLVSGRYAEEGERIIWLCEVGEESEQILGIEFPPIKRPCDIDSTLYIFGEQAGVNRSCLRNEPIRQPGDLIWLDALEKLAHLTWTLLAGKMKLSRNCFCSWKSSSKVKEGEGEGA